ncbi:macrophage mannose receptor 1-like [Carassius auratus]|uniref:Macrophage mannose receptor 1-like n=1 Tax=Carassius auratus TaxID=7957 RepID=A0A6P6NEK7_CARAU|nr:macrophage mannose receptor 1-like [Carassius auratus]
MEQKLLLILMICGINCVTGLNTFMESYKNFYFVNEYKTFAEAQQYCREHYIDLVTLEDWADMKDLLALENVMSTDSAWIGLRKTGHEQWRWADPELYKDRETEYRNWGPSEPTNGSDEYCSVMDSIGNFRDTDCQTYSKYMLVNGPKSWREAQSYCRQSYTELVSVRNQEENRQIQQLIPAGVSYMGLFKDAFVWSDNSTSSFRNWDYYQPDRSGDCVVHLRHSRLWDDQDCSKTNPFFCYDRTVVRQILRLKVESDQNVNDPDITATILQEIKQKMIYQGLSVHAYLQWKQQANGDVFQREEKTRKT